MDSLVEHTDVLIWFLGLIMSCLGWFIVRTLAKIDKNQEKLFETVGTLATQLAKLQGAYEVHFGKDG